MTALHEPPIREDARNTILPSHAWILGLVVAQDGSYVPPPAAMGPHTGMSSVDGDAREEPVCTCPDFCELDHEFD